MKKSKLKVPVKKTSVKIKKAASKKTVKPQPKKSAKPKNLSANSEIKKLKTELSILLDKMNVSEVNQIVRQAQILIYNKSVIESVNLNNEKRNSMEVPDKLKIKVEEASDNSYFIILINGARNFFSKDEMRKVVKICSMASNEKEGAASLYNYFSKNRVDVINDTFIHGSADQALITIYNYLIKNYKVKQ